MWPVLQDRMDILLLLSLRCRDALPLSLRPWTVKLTWILVLPNKSPVKILRSFPPLDAAKIKALAVSLVSKIPDELYDEIVRHAK